MSPRWARPAPGRASSRRKPEHRSASRSRLRRATRSTPGSGKPDCLTATLFPSRIHSCPHLTTRQYQRLVKDWVATIGLDPTRYGSHSLRRTKATQIYKRTGNLRAVQLLLGHAKIESTVQYLGVEVEDALTLSEQIEL